MTIADGIVAFSIFINIKFATLSFLYQTDGNFFSLLADHT